MPEKYKIKYRNLCNNIDKFYEIIDEWNIFLISNPSLTQEDKLNKLEEIKDIESDIYNAMKEDINAKFY